MPISLLGQYLPINASKMSLGIFLIVPIVVNSSFVKKALTRVQAILVPDFPAFLMAEEMFSGYT